MSTNPNHIIIDVAAEYAQLGINLEKTGLADDCKQEMGQRIRKTLTRECLLEVLASACKPKRKRTTTAVKQATGTTTP